MNVAILQLINYAPLHTLAAKYVRKCLYLLSLGLKKKTDSTKKKKHTYSPRWLQHRVSSTLRTERTTTAKRLVLSLQWAQSQWLVLWSAPPELNGGLGCGEGGSDWSRLSAASWASCRSGILADSDIIVRIPAEPGTVLWHQPTAGFRLLSAKSGSQGYRTKCTPDLQGGEGENCFFHTFSLNIVNYNIYYILNSKAP